MRRWEINTRIKGIRRWFLLIWEHWFDYIQMPKVNLNELK